MERLVNAGVKVYALQDLHTKLYIFNKETIIMGSANFTFRGFYKNHEFGVLMENEIIFAQECSQYFEKLLADIIDSGDWEVTSSIIEKEKNICDRIIGERAFAQKNPGKNASPSVILRNPKKWGAVLSSDISNEDLINDKNNDFLEEALYEDTEVP